MMKNFGTRPGVLFYDDGKVEKVPRRDGTITTIPRSYYDDCIQIDLSLVYSRFLKTIDTHIVIAKDDEVL